MILPAWCEHVSHKAPERFADFFSQVFSIKGCPSEAVIEQGVAALRVFIGGIGLKQTMTAERADAATLNQMAEATLGGREYIGWGLAGLNAFDIAEIYRRFIIFVA